jgi:hypothetical protein
MIRNAIRSFNAGELTPQVDARSDVQKFAAGCRVLDNMIPRIYGSADRRPGFKYIDDANSNSVVSRMVEFEYSDSIAYMMEFSNLVTRFFFNGAVLQSGGVDVTLTTPYLEADLFELQFTQANDVVWITHPSYAPRKLTRTTATSFSLDEITFTKGPFLPRNDFDPADGVTMTPSVTTGTGTLTASSATFTSDHVGALFKLTQPRVNTSVSGSKTTTGVIGTVAVDGEWTFTTEGTWTAQVDIERNEDGTNWEKYREYPGNNGRNIQITKVEDAENVQYRINVSSYTSGTVHASLTVNDSTEFGICRVDSFTSDTVVGITVLKDFASTDATIRWAEGAWSAERGYPTAFTFFEDRAVYGFTTNNPQTVWFSKTGDYENFKEGVISDDSFALTANSQKRNSGKWIAALEALVFGTLGGTWRIRSNAFDQAITPRNFSMKQQTPHGTKAIQAIAVGDAILYVDKVGRKIRELAWNDDVGKYISPDLTAMAEHITESGITSMAYQKDPDPIVWMTLTNGSLISMTYERDQDVVAFAKHPLGGTSPLAKSVAVIPGSTEDEVWVNIMHTIGGQTVQHICQMQPRDFGDLEDAFFVDYGGKYDSTATTTITGLGHLNGETVSILADGAVVPPKTVSGGSFTLDESASVVIYGLPYRYKLKPMRMDLDITGGTTQGTIKKIHEIVVSFYRSGNVEYGTDENNLLSWDWRTDEDYDSPPDLFTGSKPAVFDGGFSPEDSILITGDSPLPCTVRAIVARMEITGR